jgi:ribonuclease HI
VALIPKVKNPEQMKDLRPISLCNVIYKLVSKVLAYRLKPILQKIIAPNQSAFVPGRLITDNILLAYEVNHFLQNKRNGKVGFAALKLDMSKAYDRVEWLFLERLMRKMGFHEKWINLIMKCCSTVKYRFKINGHLTEELIPGRGIRQGDPISPYLFLICAEAFSSMLNQADKMGKLEGIKICNEAPSFNHLLFADDSLILLKVSEENVKHLQHILNLYEVSSGQTVNIDKSSVVFSKNTSKEERKKLMARLGINREGWNGKYLGLPVYIGRSRKKTFNYLKERIWQRIQGWKEKMLSKAGKEILIKACATAIPTYAMTCFDITKSLCEEISSIIGRFWWAQQDKDNKIHWLSWEKLTRAKKEGGLGFKDLHAFNLAMLAKQGWRLLTNPESLSAKVMKAKYYPNSSLLQAEEMSGISYAWRSILKGIELLKKGIIKRVGDGTTINIWDDPWLPRLWSRRPITPKGKSIISKVSELIDPNTGSWDKNLVQDIFWSQDANMILAIPLFEDFEDEWAWHFENSGQFSVKSAYRLKRQTDEININGQIENQYGNSRMNWNAIWNLECPTKVKMLIWRIAHNSLPHRLNLNRKGMEIDPICPVCNRMNEDGAHLFLKCKVAKTSWNEMQMNDIREKLLKSQDSIQFIMEITQLEKKQKLKTLGLIWWLWQSRNKTMAGDRRITQDSIPVLAKRAADEFDQYFSNDKCLKQKKNQTWNPPKEGVLKINIDGSFLPCNNSGGWGFIIRDANGEPMGAGAGSIPQANDALQTEAIACLTGLQWAQSWGITRLQVETDSQLLLQAIKGESQNLAVNGHLFREIKYLANMYFNYFDVCYCPRTCNNVADVLASFGVNLGSDSPVIWLEEMPEFVKNLVASEPVVSCY